jgi:hypothetical protein
MTPLDEIRDAVKLAIEAVTELEMDASGWFLNEAPDAAVELEDAANEARNRLEGWLEAHPASAEGAS